MILVAGFVVFFAVVFTAAYSLKLFPPRRLLLPRGEAAPGDPPRAPMRKWDWMLDYAITSALRCVVLIVLGCAWLAAAGALLLANGGPVWLSIVFAIASAPCWMFASREGREALARAMAAGRVYEQEGGDDA